MVTSLNREMLDVARRSLDSLRDIGRFLQNQTQFWECADLDREVARAVRQVFDRLAWSDGVLDRYECHIFDSLRMTDTEFARKLADVLEKEVAPADDVIPSLLVAAYAYDRENHSHLAPMVIDNLETLGYAIVAGNGVVLATESDTLKAFVAELRAYAQE